MLTKMKSMVGLMVIFCLISASLVLALTPEGPTTFTNLNSTRRTAAVNQTIEADAGNITWLNVVGSSVTQSWQGYVGNVSGTITLDDSAGNTLYNWSLADPEGEIYSTFNPTLDWTTGNVVCWNWSNQTAEHLNLTELEQGSTSNPDLSATLGASGMGLADDDVDGVNETFSYESDATTHSNFYVGGQLIVGNSTATACPSVQLYNSTGDGVFEEVLLYDDASDAVIFTSILQSDVDGYNGQTWDFEMIVGENGHNGNTTTTTYYFYVELQ